MNPVRMVSLPAFTVLGRKTWISGQDNALFGRFRQQSQAGGLLDRLQRIRQQADMSTTGGTLLGISQVEADPSKRAFYYMIAVEPALGFSTDSPDAQDLEPYIVPAAQWAVFDCTGPLPDALAAVEMYAFLEWLPASGFRHAPAPEMEVYPPEQGEQTCAFWLPVESG